MSQHILDDHKTASPKKITCFFKFTKLNVSYNNKMLFAKY